MKYGFCRCFYRHGKSIHHNTSAKLQKSKDLKTQSVLQFAFFNFSDKGMVNQTSLESTLLTFIKLSQKIVTSTVVSSWSPVVM